MEAAAARTEAGAARMEAAAERTENRLEADLERTAELLGGDPWEIGPKTAAIEKRLEMMSNIARGNAVSLSRQLDDVKKHLGALKFGWRAFLLPGGVLLLVLVVGMLIESQTHLFDSWL